MARQTTALHHLAYAVIPENRTNYRRHKQQDFCLDALRQYTPAPERAVAQFLQWIDGEGEFADIHRDWDMAHDNPRGTGRSRKRWLLSLRNWL